VLPVAEDHQAYADEVAARLRGIGARVDTVAADEQLGARVRKAKLEKVPYVLVVGAEDMAAATVGVNAREKDGVDRGVALDDFAATVQIELAAPSGS
jgi:threonyl-tRNA synthetase